MLRREVGPHLELGHRDHVSGQEPETVHHVAEVRPATLRRWRTRSGSALSRPGESWERNDRPLTRSCAALLNHLARAELSWATTSPGMPSGRKPSRISATSTSAGGGPRPLREARAAATEATTGSRPPSDRSNSVSLTIRSTHPVSGPGRPKAPPDTASSGSVISPGRSLPPRRAAPGSRTARGALLASSSMFGCWPIVVGDSLY